MNRHFQDARYYLKRAGEHAKKGVAETLDPVAAKGRELAGAEEEPKQGRVAELRAKLRDAGEQVADDVRAVAGDARRRVRRYRGA